MNVVLLTAAGTGTRMHQDIPKQFIHVEDRPIIIHTMETFQRHPSIDAIVVVTLKSWQEVLWAYARQFNITKLKWVVEGGETGQDSIYNGLCAIKDDMHKEDIIMIHDGNRPLVSSDIISDSFATYQKYGNAVAAVPCTEVVFISDDKISSHESIDRSRLLRTQTPHTYNYYSLLALHEEANKLNIPKTAASCELMKAMGRESYFSKGSEENIKITTLDDLKIFKALLHTKQDEWIK